MLRNTLLRHTTTLLSGTVLAQVFTFGITIWLARYLYEAEDFGYMAVFTATATILIEIVNGRYNSAIMLPKSKEEARALVGLSILIALGVSVVTAVVSFGLSTVSNTIIEDGMSYMLWFLAPAVLMGGTLQPFTILLNRESAYKGIAVIKVLQALTTGLVSLWLGYEGGFGALGLLYGYLAGLLVATAGTMLLAGNKHFKGMFDGARMKQVAAMYIKFPKFSIGSVLLNNLSKQAPVYILQLAFGAEITGQFSLSYRMLATPVLLVTTSFSQVFYQRAAELYQSSQEQFLKLVVQTPRNLFFIGVLPILFLMLYGAEVFTFVFGIKWQAAGAYTQFLAPWILMTFITVPISNVIDIKKALGGELIYNICLFVVRVSVLYWCSTQFTADITVAAFGAVSFIMTGILLLYVWQLARVFKQSRLSRQYLKEL